MDIKTQSVINLYYFYVPEAYFLHCTKGCSEIFRARPFHPCPLWCICLVEGLNCKKPIPICRLFFKIDLLTDIPALCLTDFIDLIYYIRSLVGIFDPACKLLTPWTKELYLCILVYCCPSIFSLTSSPLPKLKCTVYTDSLCGGGGGIVLVDHILQEFYTLFLTRLRTYQITSPPQTKWPVKTTLRGWCL